MAPPRSKDRCWNTAQIIFPSLYGERPPMVCRCIHQRGHHQDGVLCEVILPDGEPRQIPDEGLYQRDLKPGQEELP